MSLDIQLPPACPRCGIDLRPFHGHEAPPSFCQQCKFPLMLIAGKYRLRGVLGEGGFGTVYLADHIHLQRNAERVVKILSPDVFSIEGMNKRFFREVQVTSDLSQRNEHIVRIYDDFGEVVNLGHFYVMEYLEGSSLTAYIQDPAKLPPLSWCFAIFSQLCEAMQAAHDEGVIHRDLKPDNLLIIHRRKNPYFVKVLDFGIAKPSDNDSTSTRLTRGAVGTPFYMSPEQGMNKGADHRTDIYAMGVILYEMLTGYVPFVPPGKETEISTLEVMTNKLMVEPQSPCTIRPDRQIPNEVGQVIIRSILRDPATRYQSVEEFWGALAHAASHFVDLRWLSEGSGMPEVKAVEVPISRTLPIAAIQHGEGDKGALHHPPAWGGTELFGNPAGGTDLKMPSVSQVITPFPNKQFDRAFDFPGLEKPNITPRPQPGIEASASPPPNAAFLHPHPAGHLPTGIEEQTAPTGHDAFATAADAASPFAHPQDRITSPLPASFDTIDGSALEESPSSGRRWGWLFAVLAILAILAGLALWRWDDIRTRLPWFDANDIATGPERPVVIGIGKALQHPAKIYPQRPPPTPQMQTTKSDTPETRTPPTVLPRITKRRKPPVRRRSRHRRSVRRSHAVRVIPPARSVCQTPGWVHLTIQPYARSRLEFTIDGNKEERLKSGVCVPSNMRIVIELEGYITCSFRVPIGRRNAKIHLARERSDDIREEAYCLK